MKKYYFCMALCISALNGMDAPMSPPASPQPHSAPNSPGPIRYNRDTLLAMGASSLSRSMDSSMERAIKSVAVKVRSVSPPARQDIPHDPKKPFAGCRKRYAKK